MSSMGHTIRWTARWSSKAPESGVIALLSDESNEKKVNRTREPVIPTLFAVQGSG